MTYSPMVSADTSVELRGNGYFSAAIETPQANFPAFHALLADQLKDLAAKPVSADELARAKQPLIEGERKKLETNDFWLGKLTLMTREPRLEDQMLSQIDDITAVTAADVESVVAKYISAHAPVVAIAKAEQPQASPSAVGPGTRQ